ncbi:MAG: Maf family protein [Phycisphaeraceae bacterium]|nr:MAG: Maf family protein [Phycisphaeraceae bacterium]
MPVTEEGPISIEAGGPNRLILASRSPRRRELLREAGIRHEVKLAEDVDDSDLCPGDVSAEYWVASLAYLKARAVADLLDPGDNAVVLGADTVCVLDDEIIGQPRDRDDARRIIESFENREHGVLTGVALVDHRGVMLDLFIDRAIVRVGGIGEAEIEAYLDSENWRGKAGAYNLFERLEAGWPIEFEGDGSTIVGLPMEALGPRLSELGLGI